jgi:hypothetical protein
MLTRWLVGGLRRQPLAPGTEKRTAPAPEADAAPRKGASPGSRAKRGGYVSEFTRFIDDFVEHHPEARADQRRGWSMYWNRKVDFAQLEQAEQDTVPTDPYYYFAVPPVPAGDDEPTPPEGDDAQRQE